MAAAQAQERPDQPSAIGAVQNARGDLVWIPPEGAERGYCKSRAVTLATLATLDTWYRGNMEHGYMSRGYLLPEGCKDLIDVLKLKDQRVHYQLPNLPKILAHLPKGHGTMTQRPPLGTRVGENAARRFAGE